MGSSRVLRKAMDHEGEMRRSDDELAEEMSRGTSAVVRDMVGGGRRNGRSGVGVD